MDTCSAHPPGSRWRIEKPRILDEMRERFASTCAVHEHQLGRVLINAQIAALLVAECPKKRMFVQKNSN
jgi:hypothetical protein